VGAHPRHRFLHGIDFFLTEQDVTRKPDDPEQSKRFLEMAQAVEADEDSPRFETALRTVLRPNPKSAAKAPAPQRRRARPAAKS
jgi:hypothetical protein